MADDNRQRACSWCGSTDKLTKEHVVPAWLGRELQRQFPDHKIRAQYQLGGSSEAKVWEDGQPFSVTVKKFCDDCNNGWMSRLEADAKGFLLPLVNGADHTLTPEGQSIVAAWCFKTACVHDLVGQGDFVPSAHRNAFFRTLQPPPGVVVHLAPRFCQS